MPTPPWTAASLAAPALVVALLALSSCAEDGLDATTGESSTSPATSASSPTTPQTPETPSSSVTAPSPTATVSTEDTATVSADPGPRRPADLLLPVAGVGRLNAQWRWRAATDSDVEPDRLVPCHRAPLTAVGAEEVAVREYTSDLDASAQAHHLVAAFPDGVTARRAFAVLESWRDSCEQRLEEQSGGDDGVKVGGPHPVRGRGAPATSYVVMQATATDMAEIHDVAMARTGILVDLVVVTLEGQDYNHPAGHTPAAVSLRAALQGR